MKETHNKSIRPTQNGLFFVGNINTTSFDQRILSILMHHNIFCKVI
ncbi:MAG: hypothetical protein ACMUHX_12075 [bacterium]